MTNTTSSLCRIAVNSAVRWLILMLFILRTVTINCEENLQSTNSLSISSNTSVNIFSNIPNISSFDASTKSSDGITTASLYNDSGQANAESLTAGNSSGYIPYESRPETYIVPVIFLFIFIVGVVGNGTVIYIIYRHKTMRTVANIYILSLAAGDLTLIFISVPFVSTIYTFESWPYGLAVCKISEFARDLSTGVTVFTLTSLAVQRYTATHHPIRYLSNKGRASLVRSSALIWSISIFLASPGAWHSFLLELPIDNSRNITVCYPFPSYLDPWYPKTMVMIKFLAYYLAPLVIIGIFYSLMARSLLRSTEHPIGINNESQHKVLKNRKKISKIILGLVLIFAICFFPQHVFMLWFHFDPKATEKYNAFWHVWRIIGFVLSFLYSCLNPLLLYGISGVFRAYFKRYISECFHGEKESQLGQESIRTRNSSLMLSTRQYRGNSLRVNINNHPHNHHHLNNNSILMNNNNHSPELYDEEYEDSHDTTFVLNDIIRGDIDTDSYRGHNGTIEDYRKLPINRQPMLNGHSKQTNGGHHFTGQMLRQTMADEHCGHDSKSSKVQS